MDSGVTLRLLPLALTFIGIVAALVTGIMIYIKLSNDRQSVLTVNATVVSKDMETDETHFSTSTTDSGTSRVSFNHNFYHITFQTVEGPGRCFFVSPKEYERLIEGDQGTLTFQGGRYLGFEKNEISN